MHSGITKASFVKLGISLGFIYFSIKNMESMATAEEKPSHLAIISKGIAPLLAGIMMTLVSSIDFILGFTFMAWNLIGWLPNTAETEEIAENEPDFFSIEGLNAFYQSIPPSEELYNIFTTSFAGMCEPTHPKSD